LRNAGGYAHTSKRTGAGAKCQAVQIAQLQIGLLKQAVYLRQNGLRVSLPGVQLEHIRRLALD
jgi:hypothetical protein